MATLSFASLHASMNEALSSDEDEDPFSDSEPEEPGQFDPDAASCDYYLGKIHFRSAQAQELARSAPITATSMEQDVG